MDSETAERRDVGMTRHSKAEATAAAFAKHQQLADLLLACALEAEHPRLTAELLQAAVTAANGPHAQALRVRAGALAQGVLNEDAKGDFLTQEERQLLRAVIASVEVQQLRDLWDVEPTEGSHFPGR
jgi:hypothetical protein